MTDPTPALTFALTTRRSAHPDLAGFRSSWRAALPALGPDPAPVDEAILAGALADRLGYAFAGGYTSALRALLPGGADCLCVTEAGGAHPRAIASRLVRDGAGWRLTGEKAWSTLADPGGTLAVVASVGHEGDRSLLRVARVRGDAPGVRLTRMPETPFTPEIPHFSVSLTDVSVEDDALLPGDAWSRYVKPFRTVEDAHVGAAALAYLLGVGREAGWPEALVTRMVALLMAYRGVALTDPTAPTTHLALAGCIAAQGALVEAASPHWAAVAPEVAARWERDTPLLGIAGRARAERLRVAWAALGSGGA